MKGLKISLVAITTMLLLVLVTSGFVAAQETDASFVRGILIRTDPNDDGIIRAGETVQVAIFFHNNFTETVTIQYVGVHFDWMPTDSLYGFNMSSYNIQVASGDDYFFPQQISMKIPATASGVHSFYAGIDGVTASSTPVSLSSEPPVEFMVEGTGVTTAPTSTNPGTDNPGGLPDIVFYGAIIAVVAVVVVLLLVVLMRRKRRPEAKSTQTTADQTADHPQQPSSGQDFSI